MILNLSQRLKLSMVKNVIIQSQKDYSNNPSLPHFSKGGQGGFEDVMRELVLRKYRKREVSPE